MSDRRIQWRCFHCDEAFTKAQERWARQHFGDNQDALPACQMRVPGEHHLLTLLRNFEADAERRCAEDTDLWRAIYSQAADHATALRREEERGYEKGLADGRADAQARISALEEGLKKIDAHCMAWVPGVGPAFYANIQELARSLLAQSKDKGGER